MMKNKRGLSQVVTTVLLILIGVATVAIVAGFIIPWVRESLSEDCFKMIDKAEIDEAAYACYESGSEPYDVKLSIKIKDIEVSGFIVNIYAGGTSERFEIKPGTGDDVKTLYGEAITTDNMPDEGEERTYVLTTEFSGDTKPGSAELGVITKSGKTCEVDSAELYPC